MIKRSTKRKPHHSLDKIKALISQGRFIVSRVAKNNAREDFNIHASKIPDYILTLQNENFYHSMTCDNDNKKWQDFYHLKIAEKDMAYIKLQLSEENSVIIQFKRK